LPDKAIDIIAAKTMSYDNLPPVPLQASFQTSVQP